MVVPARCGTAATWNTGARRVGALLGAVGPRLDQNARPARLFEIVGLRIPFDVSSTDVDKRAAEARTEEFGDETRLMFGSRWLAGDRPPARYRPRARFISHSFM